GTCGWYKFKQTASLWKNNPYGKDDKGNNTNIEKAGCGPTAVASVMRWYAPHEVEQWANPDDYANPAKVADYFLSHKDSSGTPCRINGSGTNSNCFGIIARAWGFSYNKVTYSGAVDLLKKGKPVIALVGCGGKITQDPTRYTGCPKGGHYIVLTKLSGDTVSIWDPNKDNTSDNINYFADATGYLKDGFWYIYR
ncbi:MAG: hypothetical protein Athens101428_589, partial [Candidatus Berkelbacteria bacterium Athens1014_28]